MPWQKRYFLRLFCKTEKYPLNNKNSLRSKTLGKPCVAPTPSEQRAVPRASSRGRPDPTTGSERPGQRLDLAYFSFFSFLFLSADRFLKMEFLKCSAAPWTTLVGQARAVAAETPARLEFAPKSSPASGVSSWVEAEIFPKGGEPVLTPQEGRRSGLSAGFVFRGALSTRVCADVRVRGCARVRIARACARMCTCACVCKCTHVYVYMCLHARLVCFCFASGKTAFPLQSHEWKRHSMDTFLHRVPQVCETDGLAGCAAPTFIPGTGQFHPLPKSSWRGWFGEREAPRLLHRCYLLW